MNRAINEMRNLGPATARMLKEVGIDNELDLRATGSVAAFHRLKFRFGRHVSLNALYAMEAALLECGWLELDAETKAVLKDAVSLTAHD